ncbi:hypothetical protein TNIN_204871 [Trichonephila inaurata madagascariensis]|uniref:Uncharacterized protein n=1 Tax=Trichonephila inaurata madagascariensis TaxID=2747483 RepID=A0A8X7CEB5_9ARAC|nr:hypothetical protein TNIN_204871 [Trichonephila inaurata madagascariensis]
MNSIELCEDQSMALCMPIRQKQFVKLGPITDLRRDDLNTFEDVFKSRHGNASKIPLLVKVLLIATANTPPGRQRTPARSHLKHRVASVGKDASRYLGVDTSPNPNRVHEWLDKKNASKC